MLTELLLALILGIFAGTFTGLSPGIHINLVAAFILAEILKIPFSPVIIAVFIVAMSITHTFIDFIPSIFFGAPEEDTFLSVHPGHEMFREGKAHEAIIITLYGCLFSILVILASSIIFINFLPSFYSSIAKLMPFLLIFLSFYLIFREENIFLGLTSILLSGFLGLIVFNSPVKEPLLPMLSGLFGISSLFISLKSKTLPKPQKISKLISFFKLFEKKQLLKAFLASLFAPLFSFLPGIGSGHAAVFSSEIIPQERRGFLFLVGASSTAIMGLSFVTLYAINKTRSGTAAAVGNILKDFSFTQLIYIIMAIVLSGIIAFFLGYFLSKILAKNIGKINYRKINIFVIIILIFINLIFSNWLGILVLLVSSAIGIFVIISGSRRINLMGSLIIPAIVYFLAN